MSLSRLIKKTRSESLQIATLSLLETHSQRVVKDESRTHFLLSLWLPSKKKLGYLFDKTEKVAALIKPSGARRPISEIIGLKGRTINIVGWAT